jgi:hypothetical protein
MISLKETMISLIKTMEKWWHITSMERSTTFRTKEWWLSRGKERGNPADM